MAIRCTSKPVIMSEAERICKSEWLARHRFRERCTRGGRENRLDKSNEGATMRNKDAKARELRYATGIHLWNCRLRRPEIEILGPGAACQGSAL